MGFRLGFDGLRRILQVNPSIDQKRQSISKFFNFCHDMGSHEHGCAILTSFLDQCFKEKRSVWI
jgi:hypothetical protein